MKKAAALKVEFQRIRKEWDDIIAKLSSSETAKEKEIHIRELTALINKYENVPEGVKKIPLVKLCRSLKFVDPSSRSRKVLPTWNKETEIAYQDMILEFNKRLLPDNRVKESLI